MTHHATLPTPGPGLWTAAGDTPPPVARRRDDGHPGQLPRLLPVGPAPAGLAEHLERFGPLPYRGAPRRLIGDVEAAGLTGRGGAAFPTYRKLAAMAAGRGPAPVVIGNGAEGEPASSKDKSLLWFSPHLVLDGLQLAAEAVGSVTIGLYIHRNPRLHARLEAAIAERAAAGLDAAAVELIEAPHRFLAGEESALASRVSGGPALPRYKPPRASQRGVAGRRTLVQNVETLAHLALIARYGPGWFRSAGTPEEPGSMLVTLHQADGRMSMLETTLGTPIADLLRLPAQAVLIGGYHGAWLPGAQAGLLPLANAALRPLGAAVGAGVLAALPGDRCGLAETARVVRYLTLESAGQCGPCFNGLPRIAGALAELAGPRPGPQVHADLQRWSGLVAGRGACHHPDGTVRLIRSALRVFAAEIDHHEQGYCTGTTGRPFLPLPAEPPLDDTDWK
jgi:NADH:ubiquinone oxidoreductase subunit F (NADH-binding)